ncbi:amidohydrolase [Lysinibacillus sp. JNUCC-52]|uniref:amidohydrolase n=1 Tax=Lysinibacillus sp. JNUCC-52 TaxID=2792480 RepID=UPI0019376AF9|nr:amidohydrolase [Lysinibacillus sp. JNUCC-52]
MMKVDLLIRNANIITLDAQNTRANVLASYRGRIVGIWSKAQFKQAEDSLVLEINAKELDLNGATLIPGFIDTHNHLFMYALNKAQVDCSSPHNKSIADIVYNLEAFHKKRDDNSWILGFGYDDTMLIDNRHPTREDLDKVSTDRPIFIRHISNHIAVVNSKVLELANIDASVNDPEGGHYGRDAANNLNGVLYEHAAMSFVYDHIPAPLKEEFMDLIRIAAQDYVEQGITTNTDAAVGQAEYDIHIDAINDHIHPMRMRLMFMYNVLLEDGFFEKYDANQLNQKILEDSNGMAKLDSVKLFQDGSIQGLTGALRQPYYSDQSLYGDLIFPQQTLNDFVLNFHNRGFRIATHGNGDRAIGSILEAYQHALETSPRSDHRHRIEHVQTATPDDLKFMKDYQIAASFFINHIYFWGDRHKNIFLGPERAERINPLKEADDLGLLFTLHSDCPVTPISPLFSIWAAVNRVTSGGHVLGEAQKIDVETALKSMTIYGALLNFDEQDIGSIEIGKLADFAILEKDPTAVDPMTIKDIHILATIINGEIVFENKELALSKLK